jgi:hypothetical protein
MRMGCPRAWPFATAQCIRKDFLFSLINILIIYLFHTSKNQRIYNFFELLLIQGKARTKRSRLKSYLHVCASIFHEETPHRIAPIKGFLHKRLTSDES